MQSHTGFGLSADPQKQLQLLLGKGLAGNAPPGTGTVQAMQVPPPAPKPDFNLALATTLASITHALAKTVSDLSTLPGASQFISPDMAIVVQSIVQPTGLAQRNLMPALTNNNTGNQALTNLTASAPPPCKQQPATPPAQHAGSSAQQSPVTPTSMFPQATLPPAPALNMRQHLAPATLAGFGAVGPILQNRMAPPPLQSALTPFQPAATAPGSGLLLGPSLNGASGSTTDDSNSTSDSEGDDEGCEAKAPSSKRVCMDVRAAQDALAAALGFKHMATGTGTIAPFKLPMPLPAALMNQLQLPGTLQGTLLQPRLAGAASVTEMMEAAEVLAGLQNNTPALDEDHQQPEDGIAHGLAAEVYLPAVFAPGAAVAPERRGGARSAAPRKAPGKKREKGHKGQCPHLQQQVNEMPQETHAAVRQLWESHDQSLPVFCRDKDTGLYTTGTFKLVDGKKQILMADGTVMTPVEFEKMGNRSSTRNWQISISIGEAPIPVYTRPGCQSTVSLGHATRILGVHYPL